METKNWLPQSLANFISYQRKVLIISFGNILLSQLRQFY